MICHNTASNMASNTLPRPQRQDSLERKFTSDLKNSDISKRHTIASFCENDLNASNCRSFFKDSGLHQDSNTETNQQYNSDLLEQQTNNSSRNHKSYWETLETYYVKRLDALEEDIESATMQNSKLSAAREELVHEVLKLHQKSMTLNARNDALARTIAEKETHISAFMYNQPTLSVQHHDNCGPMVGVTLVDQPLTAPISPPTPPLPAKTLDTSTTTTTTNNESAPLTENTNHIEVPVKKEPGIFRQISLRLSSRKRRQHQPPQPQEDTHHPSSSLQISEPITDAVSSSSSDSILHPAVVISSPNNKLHQLADDDNNNTNYKRKKNLIFGNDLIQQARSENSVIPSVVLKCVREVEARGLSVEGIYRKSGTLGQVKELQDAFDENKSPKSPKLSKYQDINVITSLLKLYFRELSTPLLSDDFILPHSLSNQERLNKTYTLLHNMPIESYCTIKFLVQHLKRVHENQSVNRMPLKNLAVVFGPTLMRFTAAGNEEQQSREMIEVVEFIIQQSHILFADYS